MKVFKFSLSICLVVFIASSCNYFGTSTEETGDYSDVQDDQAIDKSVEQIGFIRPKGISLFGGGTHFLMDDHDQILFILESKAHDLSKYEDKKVNIKGEIKELKTENDVDSYDLVSVITVELLEVPTKEVAMKSFVLDSMGFIVSLPDNWKNNLRQGVWRFYLEESNPLVTVESFSINSEFGKAALEKIKDATEITVGGRRAFRSITRNIIDVYIVTKTDEIILIHFAPVMNEAEEKLIFLEMLTSLKWMENDQEFSGALTEVKCGGVNNKLCPVGYRCELSNGEKNAEGDCIAVEDVKKNEPKIIEPIVKTPSKEKEEAKFCTMDVKTCPDGSFVARDPANGCQFFECPVVAIIENDLSEPAPIACSMDIKICDDGTTLQRDPANNCQFPSCSPQVVPKKTPLNPDNSNNNDNLNASGEDIVDEEIIIKPPSSSYYKVENSFYDFSIDAPSNYFWRHFGAADGALSLTVYSDRELEEADEGLIFIKVVSGSIEDIAKNVVDDEVSISVPRDKNTYFIISGNTDYKNTIEHIANSVEIIEESVE